MMHPEDNFAEIMRKRKMVLFRGELALAFPESYSFQEKVEICECMFRADLIAEDAMLKDFWQLPAHARSVLFAMLLRTESQLEVYWRNLLNYWD